MEKNFLIACILISTFGFSTLYAVVLDFEDLAPDQSISETNYAGLFWEKGNFGYDGNQGWWGIPGGISAYPHSGGRNIINHWGSTLIGIQFPDPVMVMGAYFAAQGHVSSWTTGVRVHGYLNNVEIATTGWFEDIDMYPDWFAMNLFNVDRIVIESVPVDAGGGWYGMDDLTFEIPEPATLSLLVLGVILAGRKNYREVSNSFHVRPFKSL